MVLVVPVALVALWSLAVQAARSTLQVWATRPVVSNWVNWSDAESGSSGWEAAPVRAKLDTIRWSDGRQPFCQADANF